MERKVLGWYYCLINFNSCPMFWLCLDSPLQELCSKKQNEAIFAANNLFILSFLFWELRHVIQFLGSNHMPNGFKKLWDRDLSTNNLVILRAL